MKIKTLVLETNDLEAVIKFYRDILGFSMKKTDNQSVTFEVGTSKLTFKLTQTNSTPTYHYAFNIPENQYKAAKDWLTERLELVKDHEGNEIVDFPNWNAHALYFMDSVGNIGELIARHDLDNASDEPFSSKSILNISEIGLPVADVIDFKTTVQNHFGLSVYKAASAKFAPLGNTEGLFICVPLERIWFPTKDMKSALYPVSVEIEAPIKGKLIYGVYELDS